MTRLDELDTCTLCREALEAAEVMAQDFLEGYFGPDPDHMKAKPWELVVNYSEFRTRSSILSDYIIKVRGLLNSVIESANANLTDDEGSKHEIHGTN